MKKKPLKIIIIIITAILLLISAFFITRLFESKEDKALREMNVIIREYMPAKIGGIVDLVQSFDHGLYKYEDDKLIIINAEESGMELSDALAAIGKMNVVLDEYIRQNEILSDEDTEIEIRIECWANWSITLMPKTKSIILGVSSDENPFREEILGRCVEYKSIDLGGYWAQDVIVPDDIDSSFFSSFTNLESLNIDWLKTDSMKETLDNALKGLPETCVSVNTEVRRSYSGE